MDNGIKIRVKLTPEGSAILGGQEWAVLDLTPGFSLRGSKDVETLSDINEITTDGLLAFSLPESTTNNAAFIKGDSPIITDNTNEGIEAVITEGAHEWPFDTIWIKGKNPASHTWEVEARRSPNHWLSLASEKKLHTIDMGTQTVDADLLTDLADQGYIEGGEVTRWFPVDYGGWVDLQEPIQFEDDPVKRIWLEDLRPWVSVPYLLKQGFCEIGWTLEGQILDSPWSLAQWTYVLDRIYYNQTKGGLHKIIGHQALTDNSIAQFIFVPITFDTLEYDPGTNEIPVSSVWAGGLVNTLPFKSKYRMTFSGFVENTVASSATVTFLISDFNLATGLPDGQIFWQQDFEFSASETRYIKIDETIEVDTDLRVSFLIQSAGIFTLKKGYRIIVEPDNKALTRGDLVTINKMVNQEHYLLDLFKGYLHEFAGRVETIWETKTVVVHPYKTTDVYGDSVPGFIKDGETPIDIQSKIISGSIKSARVQSKLTRYTRFEFAESTDAYIDSLELQEPAYSRKVLNSLDLKDEVTGITNPFFEPTLEGQPDELRRAKHITQVNKSMAYLPRLWDNTEGERSFVIGPRILFFYGEVSQYDETTGLNTALFIEAGAAVELFGYASQKPTLPFAVGAEPVTDAKLVYGVTTDDLYVKFYLGRFNSQNRGFGLNALVLMNRNDYSEWDFRTLFSFIYQGRPIIAAGEKISDYAGGLNTSTPMDFLVEPSETTCCNLPCSCRFTECDYYQDIGQFVSQATLDELSISSFKVNGIEQLEADVELGILNLVEFGAKPFVMNLVDALNGLGIDYFTFKPSTQNYASKEDGRFFKIKRPACFGFEIIITSTVDGDVYRYRDYDQAQQWFDATWEGFGYSNEFTEPNECITTVEY